MPVSAADRSSPLKPDADKDGSITAFLLTAIARDERISQRRLASELGIAVGLVNAYMKRCVRKGLLKVKAVPQRRFAYYLTPKGFTEKSRLTAEYLSASLGFFRRARQECTDTLAIVTAHGWKRLVLIGAGDLCEIALLCALEQGVEVVAIVDPGSAGATLIGVRIVDRIDAVHGMADAYLITAIHPKANFEAAVRRRVPEGRLLAIPMLGLDVDNHQRGEAA